MLVRFDRAFKEPEMVKPRPCVVISPKIKGRPGLVTVVALSTTPPDPILPFHCQIDLGMDLPAPFAARKCWVKGDMIYAVGFHRADLFRAGRGEDGKRVYLTETISRENLAKVLACVQAGLGLLP